MPKVFRKTSCPSGTNKLNSPWLFGLLSFISQETLLDTDLLNSMFFHGKILLLLIYLKKFMFLHIKSYNKDNYDHTHYSTALS